jgi:hypothetical protein
MKKISMFKPGVKSAHAKVLEHFDLDTAPTEPSQLYGVGFKEACANHLDLKLDPAFMPVLEQMESYTHGPSRIALAHAEQCRPYMLGAAYAVWRFLFIRTGCAYIFSPDPAVHLMTRELLHRLIAKWPLLSAQLQFDAFAVWVKASPDRRLEWVHPDTLTDVKIQKVTNALSFVYVDNAHQCSNELLESLSAKIWPHQPSIIAGVPLSAQGAFKALFDDEQFSGIKLAAQDMEGYSMGSVERLRQQVGEDSDHFRSMVLAEFPQV